MSSSLVHDPKNNTKEKAVANDNLSSTYKCNFLGADNKQ